MAMFLMTVTNLSATKTLNAFDTYTAGSGPVGLVAVGGARVNQLPFPFSHIVMAPLAVVSLPVRPRNLNYREPMGLPTLPSEEWNKLIQDGSVSVGFTTTAETDARDIEGLYLGTL